MTTITRVYRADWAPYIKTGIRAIATAAAFVYTAGYVTGAWIHRLNDTLCALLVRQPAPAPAPAPVVYRCAAVPARCGIQPPTAMARAISKVRGGMSQRAAATLCGVSRSSLQRALRG